MKKYIKSARRNYGGAFDISPHMFFTKEDIVNFGNKVCEELGEIFYHTFNILDVYIVDYNRLVLDVIDDEGSEFSGQVKIDMRRIRSHRDIEKYQLDMVSQINSQAREYYASIESATNTATIPAAPGISTIQKDNIEAGYNEPPNPYDTYEPEEGPDVEDTVTESIEIDLNVIIDVDSNGSWDYEGESDGNYDYSWAACPDTTDGVWRSEEDGITLGEPADMVEYIDALLQSYTADLKPGKYRLTGLATLAFDISDVQADYDYYEDGSYDRTAYTDNASVSLSFPNSFLTDITFTPVK